MDPVDPDPQHCSLGMFFILTHYPGTYCKDIFHVKIQHFVMWKSDQDPDPDPHCFGPGSALKPMRIHTTESDYWQPNYCTASLSV